MNSLNVKLLNPDSYFSKPVYIDDNYILTTSDIPITESLIERLDKWKFSKIYTDGESSQQPASKNDEEEKGIVTAKLTDDIEYEETKKEAQIFFKEVCGFLENVYELYKSKEIISYNHVIEQIKKIIFFVKDKRDSILDMSNLTVTEHNYLISHSVKTAIVSIALAEFLKMPPHKAIELGSAALLHKVGMLKLPDTIISNPGGLDETGWKAIKAYPILGFKILQAASFPASICLAVLEHQERNNGTGYPRNIKGEQISLYGKILAVISSYCASIEKRPFKQGKEAHSGIMDIIKNLGKQYDDKIVRALVFTFSFYPIGTKVLLSNNSIAVVTKTNVSSPKEPVIKVLTSEDGCALSDQIVIDLKENTKYQILRPLSQAEMLKLSESMQSCK